MRKVSRTFSRLRFPTTFAGSPSVWRTWGPTIGNMFFYATFNYFPIFNEEWCFSSSALTRISTLLAKLSQRKKLTVGRPVIENTINTSKSLTCTGASFFPRTCSSTLGSRVRKVLQMFGEAGLLLESNHCYSAHASTHQNQQQSPSPVSCSLQEERQGVRNVRFWDSDP